MLKFNGGRRGAVVYGLYRKRSLVAAATLPWHASERFERRLLTHVSVTYIDKPYMKRNRRKRPRIARTGPQSRCHCLAHELNKTFDGREKPAFFARHGGIIRNDRWWKRMHTCHVKTEMGCSGNTSCDDVSGRRKSFIREHVLTDLDAKSSDCQQRLTIDFWHTFANMHALWLE